MARPPREVLRRLAAAAALLLVTGVGFRMDMGARAPDLATLAAEATSNGAGWRHDAPGATSLVHLESAVRPGERRGFVCHFNRGGGYGFITPDGAPAASAGDVYFNATSMDDDLPDPPPLGLRVVFAGGAPASTRRAGRATSVRSERVRGRVLIYDAAGFGFVKAGGVAARHYFNRKDVRHGEVEGLKQNSRVSFLLGRNKKCPDKADVALDVVGDAAQRGGQAAGRAAVGGPPDLGGCRASGAGRRRGRGRRAREPEAAADALARGGAGAAVLAGGGGPREGGEAAHRGGRGVAGGPPDLGSCRACRAREHEAAADALARGGAGAVVLAGGGGPQEADGLTVTPLAEGGEAAHRGGRGVGGGTASAADDSESADSDSADGDDVGERLCCVCFDTVEPGEHVPCSEGHVCCDGCFSDFVELTWAERDFDDVETPVVACLVDGCVCEFSNSQVMKHVSDASGERYLTIVQKAKTREAVRNMQMLINAAVRRQEEHASQTRAQRRARRDAERRLLAEQLRRELPQAMQCPNCSLGPIDYRGCDNVRTHQGQYESGGGVVDNRCRRCGFLAETRGEYMPWNGELPEEDSSDDEGGAVASSSTQPPVPVVTEEQLSLWRLTDLGFPEEDAERALNLVDGDGALAATLLYECAEFGGVGVSIHSPTAQRVLDLVLRRGG